MVAGCSLMPEQGSKHAGNKQHYDKNKKCI